MIGAVLKDTLAADRVLERLGRLGSWLSAYLSFRPLLPPLPLPVAIYGAHR